MKDMINATRHAALLTRLGHAPAEGLRHLADPLNAAIERGDTAANVLARAGLPAVCVTMFAAAETSSRAADLLDALSRLLERADRVRGRLFDALLYPLLLLNLIMLQLIFFSEYVLPTAIRPLTGSGGLVDVLTTSHALTLVGAIGLVLLNLSAFGGDTIEPLAARLPFAAPLRAAADEALWLRAVGCLLQAGQPLAEALRTASRTVQVARVRRGVGPLAAMVERGQLLSRALYRQRALSPLLGWAAEAGEAREDMAASLLEAADILDAQVDAGCERAVRLAQPWALALAGGGALMVLACFWLPFYALGGGLP